MLHIENLSASYNGIKAISDISMEINEGEVVALLGPNGAGKSTLLKCISAMMKPTCGTITFMGKKISSKPYEVAKAGLVHVPEGRKIFANLTVYENLKVGTLQRKDRKGIENDLEMVYQMFPILKQRKKQYGGLLSGGEQQMLAIGRGLMLSPKLLMLDEPSLGLAPIIVNQIMENIADIRKKGMSILLVEQNVYKALKVSDRAYLISVGKVEKSMKSGELLKDESLIKSYLGE